jgi:2-oxo-4-hydroxy-4-carboxy-5-ureidoimidazoline decarboxylase
VNGLDRFNALPAADAELELLACCSAPRWARAVAAARTYFSVDALQAALIDADVADGLLGHLRIGERTSDLQSRHEQRRVIAASDDVLAALAMGNRIYEGAGTFI